MRAMNSIPPSQVTALRTWTQRTKRSTGSGLGLAVGHRAQGVRVLQHQPPAVIHDEAILEPAAHHPDRRLDGGAGHVRQALARQVIRQLAAGPGPPGPPGPPPGGWAPPGPPAPGAPGDPAPRPRPGPPPPRGPPAASGSPPAAP